jgi:hypothetical protein
VVGGGLFECRLVAPEWPEPTRLGEQGIDGEGEDAQKQAPATGAAQRLHQQNPHEEAGGDHVQGSTAELPAELGGLANVQHEVAGTGNGGEEQRHVVPGYPSERRARAAGEEQKCEGQHAEDEEIVVFRIELGVTDEEAQRELLIDAQQDGGGGGNDQQPAPSLRELAHACRLAFTRCGMGGVRILQHDPRRRRRCVVGSKRQRRLLGAQAAHSGRPEMACARRR